LRIWKLSGSWYQVFCEQEEYRSSGVQEFRSSGVQEFRRILNPGQTGDRSDITGLFLGYNPPLEKNFSGSRIEVGLESPSHGHSELLSKAIYKTTFL
jgi:hypothetical protein